MARERERERYIIYIYISWKKPGEQVWIVDVGQPSANWLLAVNVFFCWFCWDISYRSNTMGSWDIWVSCPTSLCSCSRTPASRWVTNSDQLSHKNMAGTSNIPSKFTSAEHLDHRKSCCPLLHLWVVGDILVTYCSWIKLRKTKPLEIPPNAMFKAYGPEMPWAKVGDQLHQEWHGQRQSVRQRSGFVRLGQHRQQRDVSRIGAGSGEYDARLRPGWPFVEGHSA